jgi:Family of unknown function (DUF6804)
MMTRLMTIAAIMALAVPIVSHSPASSGMVISIVVSLGALVLAVRAFSVNRFVWGLVFLGVLGLFTPFRSAEFSPALVLTLDLVTIALFAISPVVLKKSKTSVVSRNSAGSGMSR